MSEEMQSNRRRRAQQNSGRYNTKEKDQPEQQRQMKKQQRRTEIERSLSCKVTKSVAKWMDRFYLDAIVGFFAPGIGDMLTSVFVFPFIYVAACKVRSLPLTLAVIYHVLRDVALGLIPFWIGDIVDVFNRSFVQNRRLIVGFVEDDKEVIQEVNRKAIWIGIMIILFCVAIYYLVKFVAYIGTMIADFFSNLFASF